MKNIIVVQVGTIENDSDGFTQVQTESFENDVETDDFYNPPNLETKPLVDDKVLKIPLDTSGENAVAMVPLKSDIEPGEFRLNIFDSSGTSKGFIYGDKNGKLTINVAGDTEIINNLNVGGNISCDGNIDSGGDVTAVGDVVAGTISLKTHTHVGSPTAVDGPPSPTGAPI